MSSDARALPLAETTLSHFFMRRLRRCAENLGHRPQEDTFWYLGSLLDRFGRSDAVFSYGLAGVAQGGQTLVEMIEGTYVAFRRAIEQMVINTTCQCNACANISTLDLKFLVHHGRFSISSLRGMDELVGSAVNEVFRLLKNGITDTTGIHAYTAYSAGAVEALGLDGFTTNLTRHTETYPGLDPLTVWVQDMHPVWEQERDSTRFRIDHDDVLVRVEAELPVLCKPEDCCGNKGLADAGRQHT